MSEVKYQKLKIVLEGSISANIFAWTPMTAVPSSRYEVYVCVFVELYRLGIMVKYSSCIIPAL
jgi:hypothetical protein